MSLINDALKKAQRQRAAAETAVIPPAAVGPGGARPGKHRRAMPAQTLLLIVAGAAVLVVLSVVGTVYLLRTPDISPSAESETIATAQAGDPAVDAPAGLPAETPSGPVVVLPEIQTPAPTPANPPPESAPAKGAETKPEAASSPPEPAAPVTPVPDERAYAFIDQLQVMGIRSSGADSKVLMNDRVYRVNDIVERSLGLRLIKVAPDSLTFADGNGATYTKNF